MRCKRHASDLSSTVGVCASCLRQRLLPLVAAAAVADAAVDEDHRHLRKSDIPPPPLLFPRSVSPYVAPRKSDAGGDAWPSHRRFFTTPQVGPGPSSYGGPSVTDTEPVSSFKKKRSGLSRLSNFFRLRSDDSGTGLKAFGSDPRVSSHHSCDAPLSSSSWFSMMLSGRRKKQSTARYVEDAIADGDRRPQRVFFRGMSPARESEAEDECEPSGSVEESPARLKRTPATATGTPAARKTRAALGKSVSGMAICLSPLVRASPSRHWRQKASFPTDHRYSGDNTAPAMRKPHISAAAAFCANRSRKLVDFGRTNLRR